jgi:hypothetical protein
MHRSFNSISYATVRAQSGQAITVGLSMLSVGLLGWALSYYLGQLVHNKISLIRATEAAALSVATLQARALNLHAYLNRAQLAHQIAMIHLVTLASHERFRANQAKQSIRMNPPAFLIGMFFGPDYAASYTAAQSGLADDSLSIQNLESAFHNHDKTIKDVIDQTRLDLSRQIHVFRTQLLEKILIKNLGDSGSAMRGNSLETLGISYRVTRDDMKDGLIESSSRSSVWESVFTQAVEPYAYIKKRNNKRQNLWAVNVRCPHKRHELRRRGYTQAAPDGTYTASDNLSFHAVRSNRIIGCYDREYPMGWSEISAASKGQSFGQNIIPSHAEKRSDHSIQNFSSQPFWRWVKNQGIPGWDIFTGTTNPLAQSWASAGKVTWSARAPRGFIDLHPSRAEFRFDIETSQLSGVNNITKNRNSFSDSLNIFALDTLNTLHAHSFSLTYFVRPYIRKDGLQEKPNLFHPYWHARLVSQ